MKRPKFPPMQLMFIVSAATAILALLSGYLQYKEKLDSSEKSLKKEQELTAIQKRLQEQSDSIIGRQDEVLALQKELSEANKKIITYQEEQNKTLKDRSELEMQANFNHIKKTLSDLFNGNIRPPMRIAEWTENEKVQYVNIIHIALASELTNQYLISNADFYKEWLYMYQQTNFTLQIFPAGKVTSVNSNGEQYDLSKEELEKRNNAEFEKFFVDFVQFQTRMTIYTKGIW